MKGAQADTETVSHFQLRLQALCDAAKESGVVLTIDCIPLQPLAMGNYHMAPLARSEWWNSDHQVMGGSEPHV